MSLVVPLFNEEHRLDAFVASVSPLLGTSLGGGLVLEEVVLVDDGSSDRTAELLSELSGRVGWTVVDACPDRHGKGDAVARGAQAAAGVYLLLSDVDLAAPLAEAGKLAVAVAAGAAMAIGSRDVAGSEVTAPMSRVVAGRAFNLFVRRATGLTIRDTQCGFKLIPVDLARALLSSLMAPGLAFDVELLMRARAGGYPVAEVPISYRHGAGSTVRPALVALGMASDVLRLAVRLRLVPALSKKRRVVRVSV